MWEPSIGLKPICHFVLKLENARLFHWHLIEKSILLNEQDVHCCNDNHGMQGIMSVRLSSKQCYCVQVQFNRTISIHIAPIYLPIIEAGMQAEWPKVELHNQRSVSLCGIWCLFSSTQNFTNIIMFIVLLEKYSIAINIFSLLLVRKFLECRSDVLMLPCFTWYSVIIIY